MEKAPIEAQKTVELVECGTEEVREAKILELNTSAIEFDRFMRINTAAEYVNKLNLKKDTIILDVGCGIGQFEQKLSELDITGLDNSKEMLEEARRRSNKTFVFGDAESLSFDNASFDAVFYVATLEFVNNYQKAIQETCRVTKPDGKLLVMMINPESEYFHEHFQREGSYFRRIIHTNLREIIDHISRFYQVTKEEYFLGIRDQQVFDTSDKRFASLYVIVGKKI